jgi:hypothetical protein
MNTNEPTQTDPVASFDDRQLAVFAAIAGHLIPAAHGMPSAGDVVGETRLRFVLTARPDLIEPLGAALGAEIAAEPDARLATLERDEPEAHAALQFVIVAGYYTDADVRERIGYPGQQAIEVKAWKYPEYLEEGLTDQVVARGPIWKDPATGQRAEIKEPT